MKLGHAFLVLFCMLLVTTSVSAQTAGTSPVNPKSPATQPKFDAMSRILKDPARTASRPFNPEVSDSPYIKGKARYMTLRHSMAAKKAAGGARFDGANEAHKSMPMWQGSFGVLGATFPFRMIGTDPAKGSRTTTVPVLLIPLQLSFPDGSQLSASQIACGDTQSPVTRILQSPLFNKFRFTVGETFVGNTQYMDAFQRANFWTDVTTKSPDYHLLLSPTLGPLTSITPDPAFAQTAQGPCTEIAAVDIGDFDQQIQNLIATLRVPSSVLPVFTLYNTFLTENGGCCILGYHSVTANSLQQPYAVSSYADPGTFNGPIQDINTLSHELGEWLDDPTTKNFIPAWGNTGQEAGCSFSLEVGDPVTGTAFPVTMNGFTYHPEDLVFLPWFARQTPSTSVNGQYTFLNNFASPQQVCQQ